jgi:hypothetical protein
MMNKKDTLSMIPPVWRVWQMITLSTLRVAAVMIIGGGCCDLLMSTLLAPHMSVL